MGKVEKTVLEAEWNRPCVRDARHDDAPALLRAQVAMAWETERLELDVGVAREGVETALGGTVGARYFVCEIGGAFAGCCMVTSEWSDWRARTVWWLQSVYVVPGHRRRGVYRALHHTAADRARRAGAAGLRLYVDRRNVAAAEVYRRMGMDGDHYLVFEQMFDRS
jgi:GNAT superfamily N-acetyltransferase